MTSMKTKGADSMTRIRVGVLFGGRSGEHEVSLLSAASVLQALDQDRFEPVGIGISKEGSWYHFPDPFAAVQRRPLDPSAGRRVLPSADPTGPGFLLLEEPGLPLLPVDVVFPVLHGTYGEDGTIQGLLDLMGVPYVGAGVLGSSVGMDKAVMKSLFRWRGLPVVDDVVILRHQWENEPEEVFRQVEERLRYPVFVKPANLGSSVGISRAEDRNQLVAALHLAARYDRKLIVEQGVLAREVECSVLGNDDPEASYPGEIIPERVFYDYVAKYLDSSTRLLIPAELPSEVVTRLRYYALEAFRAIDGSGLARVDFFYTRDTCQLYVNEINTMPGFTRVSMYPKLWEHSGLSYSKLLTRLIELAQEGYADRTRRVTSFTADQ